MPQPDETHRGVEIVVDIFGGCWGGGGVAVKRVCNRYLKNSYNACKVSLGSQAKMVSKCNRIASLVILNYKIFLGAVPNPPPPPPPPLREGGQPPSRSLPPPHAVSAR